MIEQRGVVGAGADRDQVVVLEERGIGGSDSYRAKVPALSRQIWWARS
jgi:hypothetical protein